MTPVFDGKIAQFTIQTIEFNCATVFWHLFCVSRQYDWVIYEMWLFRFIIFCLQTRMFFAIDTHLESNLGRVLLRSVCNKYFDPNNCHDIWLVIFIKTRHVIEWAPTNHIIFTNNSLSEIDRHESIHLIKIQFAISNIHCVFYSDVFFDYSKFFVFFPTIKFIYRLKKRLSLCFDLTFLRVFFIEISGIFH